MDLGLMTGSHVLTVRRAPGGDPVVYRVDGAEIALRCETTRHISIFPLEAGAEVGR
jgi:ferrous iron transport protein A